MAKVVDAIRKYFDERNRAWVTGSCNELRDKSRTSVSTAWLRDLQHRIRRKQQEMRYRKSQLLRAHSKVGVKSLQQDGDLTTAEIIEIINWIYRDGLKYSAESRIVAHVQKWKLHNGEWLLAEAVESSELKQRSKELPIQKSETGRGDAPLYPYPRYLQCQTYDRVRAQRYADLWWNSYNPAYVKFLEDDCTNFISQCLYAAGMPMHKEGNNRAKGWWYYPGSGQKGVNWSYSWSTSNALHQYLVHVVGATMIEDPNKLNVGDLVFYDWNGQGTFHHTTIVTDFDSNGDPLVNAHTEPSYHRHYRYLDSPAWTPQTRYSYVHLPSDIC
ncbi:amidase domain-containing protein [Alicyclobacillus sp. SO9]|uniref:amidase domain-containing protein n=1 Tax=Alicyclobacillus sp. SO9 TaxID=2665646 RepID=UPI0018E6ED35|nr:amidase domain-containing protein [Alicyclobacillus sp. SO9]QQE79606.1 amidase domain-containing protein [Alicyclobacillus sp. SO9]